ncbi:MAG: hypothetical protein HYX34_01205 [Actinobacteria bacterium]|nr:hypothetical protein [Actinomycetota bacterium]
MDVQDSAVPIAGGAPAGVLGADAAAGPGVVSDGGLTGRFRHTLDTKSRLVLPAIFRSTFAAGGYLTLWAGPCIAVLPPAEFRRWVEDTRSKLPQSGLDDPAAILRQIHLRTTTFRPDVQGRLSLPDELRAAIGVDRDVVVVGNGARAELWRPGSEAADQDEHEQEISLFQSAYDLLMRS